MRRTLLLATVLGLALAPAAQAASVTLGKPCYQERTRAEATGEGFAPAAPYRASLNGTPFGSGTTNPSGAWKATFNAPVLPGGTAQKRHTLSVTDGANSASARFRVTTLSAEFFPQTGLIRRLRVRFRLFGFGQGTTAYLHYIRPNGRRKRTVRLGRTSGACGHLTTRRQTRLFPFDPENGVWSFQFDTRRRYSRTSKPRVIQRRRVFPVLR